MTTYTLAELHDKRAEIAGQIIQLEKQARQLRANLAHVEATIRILRPGIELGKIVPKRVEYRPRYFKRGELANLLRGYMRGHPSDVAIADIMPLALGDRNPNPEEYQRIAVGLYEALNRLRRKGTVERIGQGWKGSRWRLLA